MIPATEADTLTMTVLDAVDLAADGKLSDGYACLLYGLRRAEEMEEEGVDWGSELVAKWREVCENYCDSYRVPLDD